MVAPSVLVREGTRKKRHNYGGDALKSSIERLRSKPQKKDVISLSHFPLERNSFALVISFGVTNNGKKVLCANMNQE